MNKVSVIIPVFNRSEFLSETLQSLADQTHTDLEAILVNDGSKPEVSRELLNLCEQYPFVQMLELDQHHGVSFARNRGIVEAKGSFIHFLDDDDKISPTFFEEALKVLIKSDQVQAVIADAEVFSDQALNKQLKRKHKVFHHIKKSFGNHPVDHWSYFLVYSPPIHSMIFRREVFQGFSFNEDLYYGEDRYLWLEMKQAGVKFKKIDVMGAYYRLHKSVDPVKRNCQLTYLRELLNSGLITSENGRNYIYTFLFLLSLKKRAIGDSLKYKMKALASPIRFMKNFRFLTRYR